MSISENITVALASLEAQVRAAVPLANASHATIIALQLNAAALVINIQSELDKTVQLDGWLVPVDPVAIINGMLTMLTAGQDQEKLSSLRGVVGRATSNLDQL